MTAAVRTSAYPKPVEELLPDAVALARRLGQVPTRNRLMTTLKIGAPKASELLDRLADWEADGALGVLVPTEPDEPDANPDEGGSAGLAEPTSTRLRLIPYAPTSDPDDTVEMHPVWPHFGGPNGQARAGVDPGPASGTPGPAVTPDGPAASAVDVDLTAATSAPTVRQATGRVWAYVGALLGGFVSIAANVAHSFVPPARAASDWSPEPGAVVGAMFWPIAVLVAVEILARIAWPSGRRWLVLRYAGLLPVALVAAVVSYRHMSGLLAHYSEDSLTVAIGPLAVDGLMVMATGALIALGGRKSR